MGLTWMMKFLSDPRDRASRSVSQLSLIPLKDTIEAPWTVLQDLPGDLGFVRVQVGFRCTSDAIDPRACSPTTRVGSTLTCI